MHKKLQSLNFFDVFANSFKKEVANISTTKSMNRAVVIAATIGNAMPPFGSAECSSVCYHYLLQHSIQMFVEVVWNVLKAFGWNV